jgi:glycosyltransferase involved in cell wall biosynthesis
LPANVSEASSIKTFNLEKDNYILALSRLVKHKGLQYLVEAFKKIKTDKKLVIVGGGAYTDEFVKELKSLAADDKRIIFTGIQSGAIIDELYSNAYLFVQPSESEGLSIALLEAMANGCATLVSDITENKEAIGNTGATFKNKNVADLQEKLEFLLDHPEAISAMGAEAKARAEQEYDVDKIINQIEEVYNNVLAEAKVEANNLSPIKVVSK